LNQLVILAGLKIKWDTKLQDASFSSDWSIVDKWSEQIRYHEDSQYTQQQTFDFIRAVLKINHWINNP